MSKYELHMYIYLLFFVLDLPAKNWEQSDKEGCAEIFFLRCFFCRCYCLIPYILSNCSFIAG